MINTFLFDLDGTILPLDWSVFEKEYFKKLSVKLSDHFKPQELIKYVWDSTAKMIGNTGGIKTNKQVFFESFYASTGKDIEAIFPLFDDFYLNEFNELKNFCKTDINMINTINILKERGYEIVVATNPIFPMTAVEARIGWAGIDKGIFKYITCFEKMHYCKPNIEFYNEVLEVIGKKPEECIMIGNDVEEDIIASKLGIKTYLVENYMINRSGNEFYSDFRGTYKDLYEFIISNFSCLNYKTL